MTEDHATSERRGRPRSAEVDRAILCAALGIFHEAGIDGLTIDGVARRAGVGRPTVYRRYRNKLDLLVAAVSHVARRPDAYPDTGNTRSDLRLVAEALAERLTHPDTMALMSWMIAEGNRNPESAATYHAYVLDRRSAIVTVLERCVERGGIVGDADPVFLADLLIAPMVFRVFITGDPVDEPYLDQIVDSVLAAFGTSDDRVTASPATTARRTRRRTGASAEESPARHGATSGG